MAILGWCSRSRGVSNVKVEGLVIVAGVSDAGVIVAGVSDVIVEGVSELIIAG